MRKLNLGRTKDFVIVFDSFCMEHFGECQNCPLDGHCRDVDLKECYEYAKPILRNWLDNEDGEFIVLDSIDEWNGVVFT